MGGVLKCIFFFKFRFTFDAVRERQHLRFRCFQNRRNVKNGCRFIFEGANMPSTADAINYLKSSKCIFLPGKAANAGGVAGSGFEMTQNSQRLYWTEVCWNTPSIKIMLRRLSSTKNWNQQWAKSGKLCQKQLPSLDILAIIWYFLIVNFYNEHY